LGFSLLLSYPTDNNSKLQLNQLLRL